MYYDLTALNALFLGVFDDFECEDVGIFVRHTYRIAVASYNIN